MNLKLVRKLCLGAAQFGLNYGIANKEGQVTEQGVDQILRCALEAGVRVIDTAQAYGNSEQVIGKQIKAGRYDFDIITKTPSLDQFSEEINETNLIRSSLVNLQKDHIYGYMIHRFSDFLNHGVLWGVLETLKQKGIVQKIGFSIYHPDELETIFSRKICFDILQIPYSIFDRRFEAYFPVLKEKKIDIYARSVFLQGLAFLDPETLPDYLADARENLQILRNITAKTSIPISALCLNFVLSNVYIHRGIIGVDSADHLRQNISHLKFMSNVQAMGSELKAVEINDEEILLPYKWSVA